MAGKEKTQNNAAVVVAISLAAMGAVGGLSAAATNNDAGMLASGAALIASEVVRNQKK